MGKDLNEKFPDFLTDIKDLAKSQKSSRNPYLIFIKKQKEMKKDDDKKFLSVVGERYREISEEEKENLKSEAAEIHFKLFQKIKEKYDGHVIIPQFLNPEIDDSDLISKADRALWNKIRKMSS